MADAASPEEETLPRQPQVLSEILRAATVQAAGLAMLNAVQHLQRTAVLVEAATATSLVRVLASAEKPDQSWAEALDVSRQAMAEAVGNYRQVLAAAVEVGKSIRP